MVIIEGHATIAADRVQINPSTGATDSIAQKMLSTLVNDG